MQLLVETGHYERHSCITDGHAESFRCEESSKKVEEIDMKETLFYHHDDHHHHDNQNH
jgi:hypothetical protein